MRRKHTFCQCACIFSSLVFLISLLPATTLAATDLPKGYEDLFRQNNLMFYQPGAASTPASVVPTTYTSVPTGTIPCTDGTREVWKGTEYNLSDDEIKGLIRVAIGENGVGGLNFELSLMANLYDGARANYSSVADYVLNSSWFSSGTKALYNTNNYADTVEENFALAVSIFRQGYRGIPLEVKNHDCIYCGTKVWYEGSDYESDAKKALIGVSYARYDVIGLEQTTGDRKKVVIGRQDNTGHLLDGVTQEDIDYVTNRNNYISGSTIVYTTYGSKDIFYAWAKPDGTGDPFYYKQGAVLSESIKIPCISAPQIDLGSISLTELTEFSNQTQLRNQRLQQLFPDRKLNSSGVVQGNSGDLTKSEAEEYMQEVTVDCLYQGQIVQRNMTVHKDLAPILPQLFSTLAQAGFEIDNSLYSFDHRHMYGDYSYLLSHHSYGTAIDLNTRHNPYYSDSCASWPTTTTGKICYDVRNPMAVPIWVANVFAAYGFKWLGTSYKDGKRYDPMHFSYTMN